MVGASRNRVLAYWTQPDDGDNAPSSYVSAPGRSEALVEVFKRYVPTSSSILEVGCNVGRNLDFLRRAGYTHLSGLELSQDAIDQMAVHFPEVAKGSTIINGSIEDKIETLPTYDVIFTMAVLIHLHPDSEWTLAHIASRAQRTLIVVEQEGKIQSSSWRHFNRRYKPIFESHGFRQVYARTPVPGLAKSYVMRVFQRELAPWHVRLVNWLWPNNSSRFL